MLNQESHRGDNSNNTQYQQRQPPPGAFYLQQYPTGYFHTQPLPEPPQYLNQQFRPPPPPPPSQQQQQQLPLPHLLNARNDQQMQQQIPPSLLPGVQLYYPLTYQQILPFSQYAPTQLQPNQPVVDYQYQSPSQQPPQNFAPPVATNCGPVRFQGDTNSISKPQSQSPTVKKEFKQGQHSAVSQVPPPPPVSSSSPSQSSTRLKHQSPLLEKSSVEERPSKKRPKSVAKLLSRTSVTYPRKRAVTACDTCRLKKTKCDNVRPLCGSCARNGNSNCQYSTDDQLNDYSSYDPASLNILTKLDVILKDLNQIKTNGSGCTCTSSDKSATKTVNNGAGNGVDKRTKEQEFGDCIWNMSVTSIIDWNMFKQDLHVTQDEVDNTKQKLLNLYDRNNFILHGENEATHAFEEKFNDFKIAEQLLMSNFTNIINSFFVNMYTKLPILNVCEFFTALELYQFLLSKMPQLTFVKVLEMFEKEDLPRLIVQVYQDAKIELNDWEIEKLNLLVEFIPLILLISALGVSAIPVHLNNLTTFKNSLDESASTSLGCLSGANCFDGIPTTFTSNRTLIAYKLLAYSQSIIQMFPFVMRENTIRSTQYYLLKSQLHLQNNNPLRAHKFIVSASRNIMYYLQKTNSISNSDRENKEVLDRLFWTCLKLESELNTELSPFVSLSGIHHFTPPTLFPKVPEPLTDQNRGKYSGSVLKLTQKYDDQYTWYYFLTEIAVRKVENKMLDDLYSLESTMNHAWDLERFATETVWTDFVRYLNQYNGIINSLTPEIRHFVLQEVDVDYIHKRIKKKYDRAQNNGSNGMNDQSQQPREESAELYNDIFDNLDEFLIDDDLLLRAQSESIMYIKTRVLASKLLLFRPLVYLILEDKIPLLELINAAASVFSNSISQQSVLLESNLGFDTPISSDSNTITDSNEFSSSLDIDLDFFSLNNAPLFYQKQYPDEDFSALIEYTKSGLDDATPESDEEYFKINDMATARAKILRIFFQNLISIPKLNIPRLSCHRHPGSWYYIRNLFIGSVMQYLLFKKIQQVLITAGSSKELQNLMTQSMRGEGDASGDTQAKSFEEIVQMVSSVVGKESIVTNLEHLKIVFEYWKDEMPDCGIYQEFIIKMLAEL